MLYLQKSSEGFLVLSTNMLCVFTLLNLSRALDILTGLCDVYKLHSVEFAKELIMRKTWKSQSVKCVRVTSHRSGRVFVIHDNYLLHWFYTDIWCILHLKFNILVIFSSIHMPMFWIPSSYNTVGISLTALMEEWQDSVSAEFYIVDYEFYFYFWYLLK